MLKRALLFPVSGLLCLGTMARASVDEASFEATRKSVQERLEPWVLQTYGKALLVTGDWAKEYSPTSAGGSFYKKDGAWGIHVVGWVARHPDISTDALRLIYCHELGHHLFGGGGEVESDYFATSQCAPQVFLHDDLKKESKAEDEDLKDCEKAENPASCLRIMTAAHGANAFRAYVWRKHEILDEDGIKEAVACRRRVFLEGFLGLPSSDCAF